MKYEVIILSAALTDLDDAFAYIAQDNREAARQILDKLMAAMRSLTEYPQRGANIKDHVLKRQGFRFLIAEPYMIFYRMEGQQVHVHRVLHGHRRYVGIMRDELEP